MTILFTLRTESAAPVGRRITQVFSQRANRRFYDQIVEYHPLLPVKKVLVKTYATETVEAM